MGLDWSKEQNAKSLAKAQAKRAAEEAKTRQQRDEIRASELERLATQLADRVKGTDETGAAAAVRSFVEGEVYTYEPDARDASDTVSTLEFQRDQARTELAILEPAFDTAWATHKTAVASGQAAAAMAKRTSLAQQSKVQLWVTFAVLIGLETLFQRRPLELIVRNQLPEAAKGTVTNTAIACSIGIVAIATFVLILAAKAWGEYSAKLANAASVLNEDRQVVNEQVSPAGAFTVTAFAVVMQVGLFFLRFQTGTSDSSARTTLVIGSAIIMFAAAGVAFMEYRISYNRVIAQGGDKNRGENLIHQYLALHRNVEGDIPREIVDAKRKELQAILRFLRDLQRLGDIGGEHVRQALSTVVTETQGKIDSLKAPRYQLPTKVRGTSSDSGSTADDEPPAEEPRLHAVGDDAE
jgi:hypothetical protein